MIPISQTGQMKKLDQLTFQGKGWELVTDSQELLSILQAIEVNDDEYRCMYVLTGADEHGVCVSGSTCLLEVWAGWQEIPHTGSIFVCLYDRGKSYTE